MNNVERVREVIARLGAFDFGGVRAMLAHNFVQEYPFRPMPDSPTRIDDPDTFIAFCQGGMRAFDPYAFRIQAIYATDDPHTVIAEYSSHTQLLATGAPYENRYVGIFVFDEAGLLARWREYLNPQVIADAFGQ